MTIAETSPGRPGSGLRALRRTLVGATIATLALVSLGGAVRATDSGLACPDWPACFGQWIPPADLHIWLEHSHRLLAGVVGLVIAGLTVWVLVRHRRRPDLVWPLVGTSLLILVQSALGALVVLLLLRAELVTAHLGTAALIVLLLLIASVNTREPLPPAAERAASDRRFARWATAVAALVFVQLLVGAQATGVAAAYVFNAWPVWLSEQAVLESSTARELFHLGHRFLGYAVAAAVIWLAVAARRERRSREAAPTGGDTRWLVTWPALAAGLVVVQVGLGIANVLTQADTLFAIGHLTGGVLLWTVVALLALLARRRVRPRAAAGPEPTGEPAWHAEALTVADISSRPSQTDATEEART